MGFSLSDLFGGGRVDKSYAVKRDNALGQLGDLRGLFRNLGNSSEGVLDITDPAYKTQIGKVTDILSTDPYTDSYSAGKISGATAGTDAAYQAARARLTGDLASRGLADSGTMAGGLAQIENGRAGILSGATNDVAMQAIQDRQQRAQQLLGVLGNARSGAIGERSGALGAEAGIDSNMASGYGEAYGQELQAQQAKQAQLMSLLGGLGSAAGSAYGAGALTRAAKTKPLYGPAF
jgi:hypothetical protein